MHSPPARHRLMPQFRQALCVRAERWLLPTVLSILPIPLRTISWPRLVRQRDVSPHALEGAEGR
jgi:hypothetical protein